MTQISISTEAQARRAADYEAKIARCQARVHRYNDCVFSAPSETERAPHILTVNPETGEATSCTCKWTAEGGWTRALKSGSCYGNTHKCKHAIAVERFIAAQRAVAEAETIKTAEEQLDEERLVRLKDGGVMRAKDQVRAGRHGFSLYR